MKRIYVVTIADTDGSHATEFLIRAATAAQAIHVCADPMFKARVATQDDLVKLAKTHTVKEG